MTIPGYDKECDMCGVEGTTDTREPLPMTQCDGCFGLYCISCSDPEDHNCEGLKETHGGTATKEDR